MSSESATFPLYNPGSIQKLPQSHEVEFPKGFIYQDNRTTLQKIIDVILATFRNLLAVWKTFPSRIATAFNFMPYSEYCQARDPATWNKWKGNSEGLHLLTHGFLGHPSIWNSYIDALQKKEPNSDVRVPFVPEKGNCSLEEATMPIREMVRSYLDEQISKKENTVIHISLYGVSNGARITLNLLDGLINDELNTRLKEKNLRLAVKVDAIAGVLLGTTNWKLRLANCSNFTNWFARNVLRVSKNILEDFNYKSEACKKLIENVQKINKTSNIALSYHFHASTEDPQVSPCSSSLPILNKGETFNVVHGEGHSSIVGRVKDSILTTFDDWKRLQA
ncbi:hypothetical protein [Criblamydia sequanensis]|uniref:DUF676 domain-containing protein n=1 Tax=Candidatus Criblamydia sequanensis CRIB-18 TaxID=1437425 RepID=A0A090CYF9_9BACT|nr:hypothetical protein [Criblamydia sequanensis]CDR33406.1 hypothetical protein CSEC_0573 [Criblamydia sequanensis CRIB-18]